MDSDDIELTVRDSGSPAVSLVRNANEEDEANSQHPMSLPPVDGGFSAWSFVSLLSGRNLHQVSSLT